MPFGMCPSQNCIVSPTIRYSMSRAPIWAAMDNPYGPAPMIATSAALTIRSPLNDGISSGISSRQVEPRRFQLGGGHIGPPPPCRWLNQNNPAERLRESSRLLLNFKIDAECRIGLRQPVPERTLSNVFAVQPSSYP